MTTSDYNSYRFICASYMLMLNSLILCTKYIQQEERRRQMAEAAEKRAAGDRSRGVKDPGSVKRMEERRDELERRQAENVGTSDQPTLRVSLIRFLSRSLQVKTLTLHFSNIHTILEFSVRTCVSHNVYLLQWTQGWETQRETTFLLGKRETKSVPLERNQVQLVYLFFLCYTHV